MTEFLVFSIYAPFASWGDIAVGEMRGSWDRPSRSAVLGLLAAAMGIHRDEADRLASLDASVGMAVRVDAPGIPITDYHTAETISASQFRKRKPRTRAEMLDSTDRETILSRREYRQDSLYTLAIWMRRPAELTLSELVTALRNPAFVLYAGRKANALGLPLEPECCSGETIANVFAQRPLSKMKSSKLLRDRLVFSKHPEVSWDGDGGVEAGMVGRRETRRDAHPNRDRWQFAERTVHVATLPAQAEVEQ